MIFSIISEYHKQSLLDKHHRFLSWEHCYKFFKDNHTFFYEEKVVDHASLHLAFYLASWGMLRGGTFLLQKDYKVHEYLLEKVLENCLGSQLKVKKQAFKLHVGLKGDWGNLHNLTETTGFEADINSCPKLLDHKYILLADRSYGKYELFNRYQEQEERQYFVIRLRNNPTFTNLVPQERKHHLRGALSRI
ncbi:transposase [Paenibacillus sp. FSL H7-0943]|uniref:transposase n=1 Tax=Paenibacillus sp. FSL H7-0943 TaxID=2954739 RepID=UPI0030CAEEA5